MTIALFPEVEPSRSGMLAVSTVHRVYWEEVGPADGVPVVFLHGGPGGGCAPWNRRLFDPRRYRVLLFDQRGCGRSTPHADLRDNTTWDLVADIERLRELIGVERWLVFGGSWGSTLALAYAQAHPQRVTGLILRGVFCATAPEMHWFYQDGTRHLFPDAWEDFVAPLREDERGDVLHAYHRRLTTGPKRQQIAAARAWTRWEMATSRLRPEPSNLDVSDHLSLQLARLEAHYFVHDSWFQPDQLFADLPRIAHLPCWIVQGRYDAICPPSTAWRLHRGWPGSKLWLIDDAGHSAVEAGTLQGLMRALQEFADLAT